MMNESHAFQSSVIHKLTEFFTFHPHIVQVWLAYSGGVDSQVLLQIAATLPQFLSQPITINAVHVHHGLSPHATAWASHCQQQCDALQIPLNIVYINVHHEKGHSLEETARDQRYREFAKLMDGNSVLLTAHHQDDQAETVLLRLFSGSGPKGLASMPAIRTLGQGMLMRPLLTFSRQQIDAFAREKLLSWIEDESNLNSQFSRNFVRGQIIPLLQKRWPALTSTLARSAALCHETDSLLQELMQNDIELVKTAEKNRLNVSALKLLSKAKQAYLLRHWIECNGHILPSYAQLNELISSLLWSEEDRMPVLKWNNTCVRRFQDELYIESLSQTFVLKTLEWNLKNPLFLPSDLGQLNASLVEGQGVKLPSDAIVTVKFRHGGERAHPQGRVGSHPLKKLFQEWKIPPWKRDKIPLIYYQQHLIAVVGWCVCEPFLAKKNEMGLIFTLS